MTTTMTNHPPPLAASYDSEPAILFEFRGQEAVATVVIYTKIMFYIFSQGYLFVLLGLYSSY